MRRVIDIVLWSPTVFLGMIAVYAVLLAPAGSCGSQHPGLCFGLGMLAAFIVLPLALICTPIAVWRYLKKRR